MKTQVTIAILVGAVGFITFTVLLIEGVINGLGYFSLLSLLALVCIVTPVLGRLSELDIKNLKLTLQKIETTKEEIYAKEESLNETSYILSEVIAANSTLTGMFGDKDSHSYGKAIVKNKINKLGKNLKIPQEKIDELFKYQAALDELQQYSGDERNLKWKEFVELLKQGAEQDA
ncbi:MAG: hypothetical protein Q7V56_15310 [Gammaproteobacteria bacterium]|nr:hypothetical protein [Gammaproteobacteria bacterium]